MAQLHKKFTCNQAGELICRYLKKKALEEVALKYGLACSYYVDWHSIFRFIQERDSLWRKHSKVTDEADPQWSLPAPGSADIHRKPPHDIGSMLCIKEKRTLRKDNSIFYSSSYYQILDDIYFKKVDVKKHLDGNIYIKYNGKNLKYSKIEKIAKKETVEIKDDVRVPFKPKPYHLGEVR